MKLGELARLCEATLQGDGSLEVVGITHRAQEVRPGFVFAALAGVHHHGLEFLPEASQKGAVAVLSDRQPPGSLPFLASSNPRRSMALAAWALAGNPQEKLTMIGVTGTNGKSTVCDLTARILEAAGHKVGVFGTLGYRLPESQLPASLTSPEAPHLAPLLAQLLREGGDAVAMEVSSHALALERVAGLAFDVAVWTNFTQDHLDFHRTMDNYFATKAKLFELLRVHPPGVRVLNADDPALAPLRQALGPRDLTFGLSPQALVRAEGLQLSLEGSSFTLVTPQGQAPIALPLLGHHNVLNALAAAAAAVAVGCPLAAVVQGLGEAKPLPGRLQPVPLDAPFSLFVDYAHTPDALEKVLTTLRSLTSGRLILVFGCGGDRDQTKRPLMGCVAARLADVPIVTSDNPRSEDPAAIIAQILQGMETCPNPRTLVLPDRRDAIAAALKLAEPGSVVLLAGKGHEEVQIFADRTVPFSDRQVALELWQRRKA
jgi:UDP-N-acetylmuramoyl-L-alanyl-D-glutamate--2,6-diaminopimelate ligase